ncbi:MAG: DNA-binding protein [Myxococcaceae bacterium]|nr:MAG: DNA-binding protein [Myxococcaceae bacterium]
MAHTLAVVVTVASTLLGSAVLGQGGARGGGGGWGTGGPYQRLYDPTTVQTVKGEIEKVERITPMHGMSAGVHLILKTEKESISVHLGPEWFISNQEANLEPKERIEVKGSRVTINGRPALVAAQVVKGDQVLKLRDDDGVPMWCGWHRRQ